MIPRRCRCSSLLHASGEGGERQRRKIESGQMMLRAMSHCAGTERFCSRASRPEAMEWANQIAPEHITVAAEDLPLIQNAGSVFVGDYSAQAAGDYASGPNHVLPTAGVARFRGGLSVMDFVKVITVQELSRAWPADAWRPPSAAWPNRGAAGARGIHPSEEPAMLKAREAVHQLKSYHPPLGNRQGLRLDFNENTVGLLAASAGAAAPVGRRTTGPLSGARSAGSRGRLTSGDRAGRGGADQWHRRSHPPDL